MKSYREFLASEVLGAISLNAVNPSALVNHKNYQISPTRPVILLKDNKAIITLQYTKENRLLLQACGLPTHYCL